MFFFTLASLARSCLPIGFLDRPLVSAFFIGLFTNSLEFALPLGIVFELFGLDFLRLGAVIPPSSTLSFLLLYPFTLIFNWHSPSFLAVPILICLPLAYTVPFMELIQRKHLNSYILNIENWIDTGQGKGLETLIYKSLLLTTFLYASLYILLFCALFQIFSTLNSHNAIPEIPTINWTVLYIMGLLGAILALLTKRAYAILIFALAIVFLLNF